MGEDFHDPIDRFGRIFGVQCSEDQVPCGCGFDRQGNRFEITHFSNEDNVRVFTQGTTQRRGERHRMQSHLSMIHDAPLTLVHELDGIFDRENVIFSILVGIVDHGSQGRGLTAAGWTSNQDQPFF